VCAPAVSPAFGTRYILSGISANTDSRFVSGDRVKVRVTVAGSWVPFTAHFDLVQVVGVDAGDSDLDWNHDGVVDAADAMAFLYDWSDAVHQPWVAGLRFATGRERWALDATNDGLVGHADPCAFASLIEQVHPLSAEERQAFNAAYAQETGNAWHCP
jgi:hypothetical protein